MIPVRHLTCAIAILRLAYRFQFGFGWDWESGSDSGAGSDLDLDWGANADLVSIFGLDLLCEDLDSVRIRFGFAL